jgi:hypothetical protein
MATPSGPTLTCSQCGFVNEAERVYCHNCGAKLDRSLLPQPEHAGTQSIEKTRKRVQKMANPGGSSVVRELKALANTLIWAALVAAIVQFVREPADVPPAKSDDLSLRMVSSDLTDAVESPQPRAIQFTEGEVNSHLRSSLKTKATGMLPGVKFERAYVKFDPGNVNVGLQQSIGGYPIYSGVRYEIGVKDGKLFAINHGGNFGRLSIHPALMQYVAVAFKPLFTALKREQSQMEAMQRILVEKGRITLVTKGRTP